MIVEKNKITLRQDEEGVWIVIILPIYLRPGEKLR